MVDEGTWRLPLGYVGGDWQIVELSQPKLEALVDPGAAVQVVEGTALAIGLMAYSRLRWSCMRFPQERTLGKIL